MGPRSVAMTAHPVPRRRWRSYGDDPLPTGTENLGEAAEGLRQAEKGRLARGLWRGSGRRGGGRDDQDQRGALSDH
jgi:hypothetical protein